MGPEDKNEEMVVYCDGKPVGMDAGLPEIIVGAERIKETVDSVGLDRITMVATVKIEPIKVAKLWVAVVLQLVAKEFDEALRWAEENDHPLVYRYRYAKKGRIKKKYRKRLLAWYREAAALGGIWTLDQHRSDLDKRKV